MIRSGSRGKAGTNGTNGTNGANGIVPTYNSAGLVTGVKMWIGTATTNASGQWSVNYSTAGFTQPPLVNPQPISASNAAAAVVGASITAPSTTAVSGACFLPNAISLLGVLPLQQAGAGIVVQVTAIGV